MRSRLFIAIAAISVLAAAPAAAQANVLHRLYAPLHVHPKIAPAPSFIRSHFPTITVQKAQLRKGYHSKHTGLYTKGTRSRIGTYPESWYLHTAGGARVRDRARGFYVMNPASSGWRKQVVKNCKGSPSFCFLDAMGSDGYDRTNVHPNVSLSWWTQQTLGLANYVSKASSNWGIAANNLLAARGANYLVAYEMFARESASRSLDVLRHTKLPLLRQARHRVGRSLRLHAVPVRIRQGRPHQRRYRSAGRQVVGLLQPRGSTGQSDGQDEGQRRDHHAHVQERDGRGQHRQHHPDPRSGSLHGSAAVRIS